MDELDALPELVDPVVIAAFEGWNDAAEAATAAVEHLEDVFDAEPLAEIDPEDYYDFQVNRPQVTLGGPSGDPDAVPDDALPRIEWPSTRLSVAGVPGGRHLVIVRGIEPSMRWRHFVDELLGLADTLKVPMVVTLGALLADTPHTRPVPVTGTTTDRQLAHQLNLEQSHYEGPTGIVGVLQDAVTARGLAGVSIWAAVPHYVAHPPCPKATLALLHRVEDLLDIQIPLGDLPEESRAWERGVDDLAEEDAEVAEYVRSLEEAKDTAELPEASGEAIAREFERYLRRRDDGATGGGGTAGGGPARS